MAKKATFVVGGVVALVVLGAAGACSGGGEDDEPGVGKPKPHAAHSAPADPSKSAAPDGSSAEDGAEPSQAAKKPSRDTDEPSGPSESGTAESAADEFRDHLKAHGTANERAAATHIVRMKVQNGLVGSADISTDFAGDLTGPHAGEAKLLANAFASWKHTSDGAGLVTVYGSGGDMLANANY